MNVIFTRLVQWIAIPLGLAVFGFYVLGPRFGAHAPLALKEMAQKHLAVSPSTTPVPKSESIAPNTVPATISPSANAGAATTDSTAGPDVQVTADPAPVATVIHHRTRRHRRTARTGLKKEPTPTSPPDSGSYLGTDEGQSTPTTPSNPSAGTTSESNQKSPSSSSANSAPCRQGDGGGDSHETNGALDGGIIEHLNPQ